MTLVEQYAQSITDRSRARQALVDAVSRRTAAVCGALDDPYHLACRAQFVDAVDYCAEMRAAYVACGAAPRPGLLRELNRGRRGAAA